MNGPGATAFDLLNCPLDRTNLIEASAGTGKTYALSGLYLRLLLERELKVSEILVVTFTEAATEELKGRIREKLSQALTRAEGGAAAEPFIDQLIAGQSRPDRTIRLLERALRCFDEAAISTIHGFCHRLLREHAFDSAGPFELEIVPDDRALLKTLVEDYWRTRMATLPTGFVQFLSGGKNPVPEWLRLAAHFVARPGIDWVPQPSARCCQAEEREVLNSYRELGRLWPTEAETIRAILSNPKVFNQSTYKTSAVADWLLELAEWLRPATVAAAAAAQTRAEVDQALIAAAARALPEKFGKFAAGAVLKGVKKGQSAPAHPLFDLCEKLQGDHQALGDCYATQRLSLMADLFRSLESRLRAQKLRSDARSYGDLLTDVRDALTGPGGDALAEAVGRRYRAALIDEFQDTDPIQYAIFDRLFRTADHSLFLIGDPKQAIYAFRGADIFAYLEAAASVDRKFYLTHNWRSDPGLIQACNGLFAANRAPFIFPEIQFQPVQPAPKEDRPVLRLDGVPLGPLELWWIDPEALAAGDKLTKSAADDAIRRAVAADIARFVGLGRERRLCLGDRPVTEPDLAVLVRTNAQAEALQEALNRLRIPSVLYQTGNLFAAREAKEMQRLLAGVLEPGRESAVRTALAGPVIGCDAAAIARIDTEPAAWDEWLARFHNYQERWLRRGFMPMFQALLGDLQVLPRLMRRPDGERMVTNLLHLAEVLHREAQGRGWGPAQLVKWLAEQVSGTANGQEEHLLRMETDEAAVRIITMHKSKGLEFPLVYCPYCWSDARRPGDGTPALCHDPQRDRRLVLDLGGPDRDRHADLAFAEDLAECMRLLYVAVTRARHRCVLVWGQLPKSALSALAYLLHGPFRTGTDSGASAAPGPGPELERLAEELATTMDRWDPRDLLAQVRELEHRCQGTLHLSELPITAGVLPAQPIHSQPLLQRRVFSGRIDRSWRLASFSGLLSERSRDLQAADRDQMPPQSPAPTSDRGRAPAIAPPGDPAAAPPAPDIRAFPRGARAGTVLHAIFEELDFQSDLADAGRRVTAAVLARYGFDPIWEKPVLDMVRRVLTTPLMATRPDFTLDAIGHGERISELEFHFPLGRLDAPSLNRFLAAYQPDPLLGQLPARIGRLSFHPMRGFMKGFIDLVFRYDGRFYLLDWKSNHLGDHPEAYRGPALAAVMAEHFYTLQYLIYTAALDRYLALRLPDYDYDSHFGGVFYVFLRGVGPGLGPQCGIYHDRPDATRVRVLQELFQSTAEDDGR